MDCSAGRLNIFRTGEVGDVPIFRAEPEENEPDRRADEIGNPRGECGGDAVALSKGEEQVAGKKQEDEEEERGEETSEHSPAIENDSQGGRDQDHHEASEWPGVAVGEVGEIRGERLLRKVGIIFEITMELGHRKPTGIEL